jgi:hypothetical protein
VDEWRVLSNGSAHGESCAVLETVLAAWVGEP